ncbi:MAG: ArsR family transcriptional regulator, partial [Actinobacteria bacterium]|nr:ArsR family transcriptional regulator [Actinomycetota bacterium]
MADIFEAIADPTRRNIMETLLSAQVAGSELTVSELVQKTGLGQPTVSKHLKTLREVGLVAAREDGQKRFYSVTPEPLEEIEDWMINFLSLGFEAEGEEDLAKNLSEAGEKLGHWITEKASWLGEQLRARADELDVDVDPKELGKRLGRKLAETKVDAEKGAKDFEKLARQKVEEVVDDVRSEATHFAAEVKAK